MKTKTAGHVITAIAATNAATAIIAGGAQIVTKTVTVANTVFFVIAVSIVLCVMNAPIATLAKNVLIVPIVFIAID